MDQDGMPLIGILALPANTPPYEPMKKVPGSQTQGNLFCPQPQPRTNAGCPSISITTDPPLVSNSYDFGTVATGDNATLTYTITGENLNAEALTINIQGGAGDEDAFSTNTTSIPPVSGNIPATQVIITFTPTATANYTATITHSGAGLKANIILKITGEGIAPPPSALSRRASDAGVLGLENTDKHSHSLVS